MKAKKNSQQTGGSGAGQLGVQKNTLKTFGTIYGSSLLRSLQTPERQQLADRSRQLQQHGTPQKTPVQIKVEPGSSPAQSTLSPGQKQISSVGSRQKRTLSPGTRQLTQRQRVLQANQSPPGASGPQLCLKFVKATGPDGKPGLTAILGASPGQQGASPQQKQTPSKGASPLQTQQQPQRMMQLSGPPKTALASSVQKSPGQVLPTRVPAPVRTQKGNSKSVPAPRDETQEAVDALIASTSDASEATSAASTEPRIGNWKNKPRAERRQDLAKTEKLLNSLRTLMSQQRSQVEAGMQQLQSKASQENPPESIQPNSSQSQPGTSQQNPQMSQNSQSQVLAALQLQKSFETGASPQKTQSESGTSPQQSQVERSPRIMGYRKRAPHKLPPDEDRLGLDQAALQREQKKSRKTIRRVGPEEAARYLESTYENVRGPGQQTEAAEWAKMMTNIDIFMFPVYRCKLCPNYYTTVKTTMIEHMKDVHRWSKNKGAGSNVETVNIGGNEGHVGESTQDRVKNIQKIFERKLRSQSSGDGDAESVHSQNSLVEIPFSSGSPPEEVCERVEQNGSVDGGDNNDDDDDDDGGGGFEDVDDDDYDVGSGGFEDVDDDNDGDGGETEEIETGVVRKSSRLVKVSTTPMIKKYYQSKTRSISPQTVDDQEKIDKDTEKTDKEKINTDKFRSWPRVVLKKTILEKVTKRLNASKKANEESEMETSIETEGASKVGTRQHYIRHTTYEEEEAESEVDQIPVEESSEDEVDMRDLNEVRPKEPPTLRMKSNAPPPRRRPDRRSRKRRKKNCYFKPGNLHFTKRAGFVSAKDRERQEKQAEENERVGEEDTTMIGVKLPPVERPKTRSLTKSDDGLASDHDMIEVTSNSPGKKRIRLSRYEAWKIIGLDPNSEPPWPCTHPSCGYYFASLNSILTHHAWKHDTFGDRNQRKLARSLGEKYSLFAKREKRAVDGAKIDDDDENADGEAGVVKSKRKKKPVKRLTNVLIGKNKHFIPKYEQRTEINPKRKKLRCKYCQRYFISQINLRTHMRRMHKTKWMKDNNLTQEDMDEITKNVAENEDASSANISLLATVADKLDDKVNLICKTCSFKAVSERALGHHMNQAHPDYIRSIYSDSDEDKVADDDADKQTPDVTPSNRPVRKCRRKSLPKIMQKEKKLDMVIPKILPHHAIYGQALPEEEAGEKEDEDDDGEDGGDELPRSGISLQCEECNYIAMSDRNFVSHMKTVHKQDVVLNYQCDQCDFSGTGRELFVHKKSHVPTVMCDMCGKTLKGDKRLKMHQMYHCGNEKKPKRYSNKVSRTCKICHKEFNNLATFRYHMTGHRNDERGETFSCDICQKTFTRKQSVRMHKTIAHMEKKFQCLHCPFKGAYKTQYRYHLWEKHDIGGETMPDLKCDFEGCTFSTKKRKQLTGHKRKHDMTRFKYWCDGCNQPIRTLTCLAKHQVLHRDGVTKYKCKECGYQATDSNTLSSHKQWKHADPSQTIICDLCGASFTRAADHNLHRKLKHTELEPVKCKGCELTFKFTYQMTKHMKVEHRDLIEAEEAAQMEEAKKIINAVPKRRTKSVEKKKRVKKKKPPTGKKVGRPKAALTPELIAKREEQKRERNKRKYENRKAKMKQLGLKRKKYPKKRGGQTSRTLMQPRKQRANAVSTAGTNEDYSDEEVATAAQQLESIAQAFTTQPQTVSPYKSTSNNYPVQVEPTDHHAYAQLTALNCEFNVGASTSSAGTLHIHPPVTTQEVVVPTDVIVGSNAEQQVETTSTTQRIVPAPSSGEMLAEGRQGEQPVSYLEVTTVHSDGRRHVEMWPVWQDP